ncbi:hypothetical protein D9M72_575640 [compost metagenome]
MLVLQLEVVPVLAAHEGAAVAVFQLQVMDALEDLREGLALLEVEAAVVDRGGGRLATFAQHVVRRDERRIGAAHRPAGAHRERGIETSLEFADAEIDGLGRRAGAKGDGRTEQMRPECGAHCCSCHAHSESELRIADRGCVGRTRGGDYS